ncbi:MAG: c-type cytochrome [Burkholderiales bacterium]
MPLSFGRAARTAALTVTGSVLLASCASEPSTKTLTCPQPRFTGRAPDAYWTLTNPLAANDIDPSMGTRLYRESTGGAACASCHGDRGEGDGPLANQFDTPPRNFACAATVNGIPDGQLFWIIRFGSPGTAMPGHPALADAQVWQLVSHLRRLALPSSR